jgi:hypothetical protein
MTTIISGRFEQQDAVQQALTDLQQAGFPAASLSAFYVNPPGQHDQYIVGGDRDKSPGATDSDTGAAAGTGIGGVAGAAAGAVTTPVTGPAGVLGGTMLGAYIGSLIGSMASTDDAADMPPVRKAGMLVAAAIADGVTEQDAIDVLRGAGASCMERTEGQIVNGEWADFDPLSTPVFI